MEQGPMLEASIRGFARCIGRDWWETNGTLAVTVPQGHDIGMMALTLRG